MTEMIERVAKAIREHEAYWWNRSDEPDEGLAETLARAAIEAMRQPTDAMINSPMARCYNDGPYADKEVRRIYSSMIDAALSPAERETPGKTEASQ